MGIQGLLPLLKSVMSPVNVSAYAGQRVGVDAYCWLHRAAFTCGREVSTGQETDKFVSWCMERVNMLKHQGVEPVLVFDGGKLPQKQLTDQKRSDARCMHRKKAEALWAEGNEGAATKFFQKSISISHDVAFQLITRLQKEEVEYVVAPYEADAQLTYLANSGYIAAVISEDSDLLVFGCSRVLFKMDKFGNGEEIRWRNVEACEEVNLANWTPERFQHMCILSGCDYLESLPGMGLKKAHGFLKSRRHLISNVLRAVRMEWGQRMPATYEKDFRRAFLTFRHQRVYDLVNKRLVHLHPLPPDPALKVEFSDLSFLGQDLPNEVAEGIATARLDPSTHLPRGLPQPAVSAASTPHATEQIDREAKGPASSVLDPKVPKPGATTLPLLQADSRISAYFISNSQGTSQAFRPPGAATAKEDRTKTTSPSKRKKDKLRRKRVNRKVKKRDREQLSSTPSPNQKQAGGNHAVDFLPVSPPKKVVKRQKPYTHVDSSRKYDSLYVNPDAAMTLIRRRNLSVKEPISVLVPQNINLDVSLNLPLKQHQFLKAATSTSSSSSISSFSAASFSSSHRNLVSSTSAQLAAGKSRVLQSSLTPSPPASLATPLHPSIPSSSCPLPSSFSGNALTCTKAEYPGVQTPAMLLTETRARQLLERIKKAAQTSSVPSCSNASPGLRSWSFGANTNTSLQQHLSLFQ
eukprot:gb/GEZN01002701.1/.p1 GENE.gb/GEZN01002701.1/~~gb/GEZN01002701.1/.p1  ORF type:complete len:701 (-),score=78.66 gb/GEZN01002701.1/:287-2362(-)